MGTHYGNFGSALAGSIPLILSYKHLLNISEKGFSWSSELCLDLEACAFLLTYKAKERIKPKAQRARLEVIGFIIQTARLF